jgi:FKBP-type peptidyl-prolyl cis-trans isomerase 2
MNITTDCVVALTWVLKDAQGELLDELDDSVEFYLGGHDLLEKIQQALQTMWLATGLTCTLNLKKPSVILMNCWSF